MVTTKKNVKTNAKNFHPEVYFIGKTSDYKNLELFGKDKEIVILPVASRDTIKKEFATHPHAGMLNTKRTPEEKEKLHSDYNKIFDKVSNTLGEIDTLESEAYIIDAVNVIQNIDYGYLVNGIKTEAQQLQVVEAVEYMNSKGFYVGQTWSKEFNHQYIVYGKVAGNLTAIERERYGMWLENNEVTPIVDDEGNKIN